MAGGVHNLVIGLVALSGACAGTLRGDRHADRAAVAHDRATPPATTAANAMNRIEPRVRSGQRLRIHVAGESGLSGDFRVSQTGNIDYPYLGRVAVSGLRGGEVRDLIAERLTRGNFVRAPEVSVAVDDQQVGDTDNERPMKNEHEAGLVLPPDYPVTRFGFADN